MIEEDAVLIDEDKQQNLDLNFHTDMPVGEILRRTRLHYGQSLQQIESVLRIRASQLHALESGDHSELPGKVYAIGFVRSYSEYLGLDGDKMVHLFKTQFGGRQKKPDLSFPVPASESKLPNIPVIIGSIVAVLLLIGFIAYMMFPEGQKNEVPVVPTAMGGAHLNEAPSLVVQETPAATAMAVAPVATPQTTDAAAPQEPAVASPIQSIQPKSRVVIEVTEPSWVEIRNAAGAAILRQVLKAGDVYMVPDETGLVMATGNAGGLVVKLDGKPLPPLGEQGQIKRKISLDPSFLVKKP